VATTSASQSAPDSPLISPAEVRAELAKVLASTGFINSARLSKFLQLAVDETLAGQAERLKEYTLGHDVFDRGADFDPRTDSIVRVEALRLRRKLSEYYEGPGAEDPLLISLQPGSYVPKFVRRKELEPPSEVSAPDLDPDTVAVLPFVNLSSDPEQALFCDGTTEEIIFELSSVPGLKVLGLTTAFALRDCKEGFMAMCQKLGVGTLVEGSVRKAADQLRIGARTVDVATGQAVWSRSFDRTMDDIFAIQDEIAQEVATALQAPARPVAAIPVGGAGVEAYTWYLRGKHAWDEGSRPLCLEALECFRKSARLAPGFALPLAGLASGHQWMALWGWALPAEARAESQHAAQESLRIDGYCAEGHVAWAAHLIRFEWDWKNADSALDRAIELNPSCGLAYSMKANSALGRSRFADGLRFYERAVQLDPLSYRANGAMGVAYWLLGRHEDAERWFRVAHSLNENSLLIQYFKARLHLSLGSYGEAIDSASLLRGQSHLLLGTLGAAYAGAGNAEKAREIAGFLQQRAVIEYVDPLALAAVHIGLNETDTAFDWLLKAIGGRSPMVAFAGVDPLFQPLRADPRFQRVLSELNLG
jgi:TolB-like protein